MILNSMIYTALDAGYMCQDLSPTVEHRRRGQQRVPRMTYTHLNNPSRSSSLALTPCSRHRGSRSISTRHTACSPNLSPNVSTLACVHLISWHPHFLYTTTTRPRTMPIQSPPLDGSLPAVWGALDWRAKHTPSDPWIVFPYGDYSDERVCLTFADCATASHRVAYALHLARVSSQDRVIAAVLVNTDNIHYALLMSGIMRAGLIVSNFLFPNRVWLTCRMIATTYIHQHTTRRYLRHPLQGQLPPHPHLQYGLHVLHHDLHQISLRETSISRPRRRIALPGFHPTSSAEQRRA